MVKHLKSYGSLSGNVARSVLDPTTLGTKHVADEQAGFPFPWSFALFPVVHCSRMPLTCGVAPFLASLVTSSFPNLDYSAGVDLRQMV
jgi:hypothetical protein